MTIRNIRCFTRRRLERHRIRIRKSCSMPRKKRLTHGRHALSAGRTFQTYGRSNPPGRIWRNLWKSRKKSTGSHSKICTVDTNGAKPSWKMWAARNMSMNRTRRIRMPIYLHGEKAYEFYEQLNAMDKENSTASWRGQEHTKQRLLSVMDHTTMVKCASTSEIWNCAIRKP